MYSGYKIENDTLYIRGIERIDIEKSCACGQSFRWRTKGGCFTAPALGRVVKVGEYRDGIFLYPCKTGEEKEWINYFDLERDYAAIENKLALDERLKMCIGATRGIRVFNQEPFETLISFIISANNNITRIAGIIERLCALCGEKQMFEGEEYRLFPTPCAIAGLSVEQLTAIGTGYRAPYIIKSAAKVAQGYSLEKLREMPLETARKELLTFPGVGPKVADCVLLFGLGHTDAFPVDVWMGRAMSELYFDGENPKKKQLEAAIRSLGKESGIVQQYIFHYARQTKLGTGGKNRRAAQKQTEVETTVCK